MQWLASILRELRFCDLRLYGADCIGLKDSDSLRSAISIFASRVFDFVDYALQRATKTGYNLAPSSAQFHHELEGEIYLHVVLSIFALACALVLSASQFVGTESFPFLSNENVSELWSLFARMSQTNCSLKLNFKTQSKICQRLGAVKSMPVEQNHAGFASYSARPCLMLG